MLQIAQLEKFWQVQFGLVYKKITLITGSALETSVDSLLKVKNNTKISNKLQKNMIFVMFLMI